MQRWEQQKRQRAHHNMIEQAKPTIKRYSKSRQKPNLSGSRTKTSSNNINMPFSQVLLIFQLDKYQQLLSDYGFPQKIKDKQSSDLIDQMLKKVDVEDQQKFLSLMSALLSISSQLKSTKRTHMLKRSYNKHHPPTHNSTNLKKCDSLATKKGDKTPNFRIKSKTYLHHQSIIETPMSKVSQKSTIPKKSKAKDDSIIVHQFNLRGRGGANFISKKSGLLNRIQQRLRKIKGGQRQEEKPKEINLYYKEIKQMYLSYDTATLTSNISNIDIQQIIDCYSIEVEKRIMPPSIKQPLNPEKLKKSIDNFQVQKLLKKSLIQSKLNKPLQQNNQGIEEAFENRMDDTVSVGSSDDEKTQIQESQFFDFEKQSFSYDLSCFNYRYQDETLGSCSKNDIKNFVQLVMMAGKMEKQTPIISFCYLTKILNICKKERLSCKNWKNMILITLIQASKIWDDQSLENHSFSKVIKPYTTLQINRLERHLLNFLNYRLKVEAKQYCESYFILRIHSKEATKTANLMPLTLETIKKLQGGAKKSQRNLKQTYKKKLNESF